MSRLLSQLPAYYENIKDFRELSKTVTKSLNDIDEHLLQLRNDQYIISSSKEAIKRREKDFSILADEKNETLGFRKKRLLTRMRSNPPYVLEYLKNMLDSLLGEKKHSIELDKLLFEMEVLVNVDSASFYLEVEKLLERIVPLNIQLTTAVLLIQEYLILQGGAYTFEVEYKRTGNFRTAPIDGMGKVQTLIHDLETYIFEVSYRRCGKFRAGGVLIE